MDLHQLHLASSSGGSVPAHMVELVQCHRTVSQCGGMDAGRGNTRPTSSHIQAVSALGLQQLLQEGIAAPLPCYKFREDAAIQCCHFKQGLNNQIRNTFLLHSFQILARSVKIQRISFSEKAQRQLVLCPSWVHCPLHAYVKPRSNLSESVTCVTTSLN